MIFSGNKVGKNEKYSAQVKRLGSTALSRGEAGASAGLPNAACGALDYLFFVPLLDMLRIVRSTLNREECQRAEG